MIAGVVGVVSESPQALLLVVQSDFKQLQPLLQLFTAKCVRVCIPVHAFQLGAKRYQVMVELLDLSD